MRVYELSKQLDIPSKQLVEALQEKGFDVKNHMSALSDDATVFLQNKFSNKSSEPSPTQKETMQKEQIKKTHSKPPRLQKASSALASSSVKDEKEESPSVQEQKLLHFGWQAEQLYVTTCLSFYL